MLVHETMIRWARIAMPVSFATRGWNDLVQLGENQLKLEFAKN